MTFVSRYHSMKLRESSIEANSGSIGYKQFWWRTTVEKEKIEEKGCGRGEDKGSKYKIRKKKGKVG